MNLKQALDYFERKNPNEVILSDVNVVDKDINGGKDFEEANRKIIFTGDSWLIKLDHSKTIQPDFGKSITKTIEKHENKIEQEELISFLHGDAVTVKELSLFYKNLII